MTYRLDIRTPGGEWETVGVFPSAAVAVAAGMKMQGVDDWIVEAVPVSAAGVPQLRDTGRRAGLAEVTRARNERDALSRSLADVFGERDEAVRMERYWRGEEAARKEEHRVDRARLAARIGELEGAVVNAAARLSMAAEWEWPITQDGDARSIVRQEAAALAALAGCVVCPSCKGSRAASWQKLCETCSGAGVVTQAAP